MMHLFPRSFNWKYHLKLSETAYEGWINFMFWLLTSFNQFCLRLHRLHQWRIYKKINLIIKSGRETRVTPCSHLPTFTKVFIDIFWTVSSYFLNFLTLQTLRFHDYFFYAFLVHVNHISSWNLRKQLTTFYYFFWECKLYFHGIPLTLSLSARSETDVF